MENEYLYRKIDDQLLAWSKENKRKPLLVRGARQVGKSSAIRNLAHHFEYFVEVNFDQQKKYVPCLIGDFATGNLRESL